MGENTKTSGGNGGYFITHGGVYGTDNNNLTYAYDSSKTATGEKYGASTTINTGNIIDQYNKYYSQMKYF